MKETILVLNIPNYYCSYYLLGLSMRFELKYQFEPQVERFNNRAFLIFKYRDAKVVIDNNDPSGIKPDLYEYVDFYFVTNKLNGHPDYQKEKIRPLFPHYPVNVMGLYLRTFGLNLIKKLKLKALVHQLHILRKRPTYQERKLDYKFHNYVFFSANLWKKEAVTNEIRAEFIRACKAYSRIDFEGGFVQREDRNDMGYPNEINQKIYPPQVFSQLSSKTLLALNNPAVLGAVSWRLAEYFASGIMVLSYPSAVEFPIEPKDGEELKVVTHFSEFTEVFDVIFDNPQIHQKISKGAKSYFDKYCTPEVQVDYILDTVMKSVKADQNKMN